MHSWLILVSTITVDAIFIAIVRHSIVYSVVTCWTLGDMEVDSQVCFSIYKLIFWAHPAKLDSDEWRRKPLMMSQHWFRQRLGALRQQPIAWAKVDPDLCRHWASLDHNGIIFRRWKAWVKYCAVTFNINSYFCSVKAPTNKMKRIF